MTARAAAAASRRVLVLGAALALAAPLAGCGRERETGGRVTSIAVSDHDTRARASEGVAAVVPQLRTPRAPGRIIYDPPTDLTLRAPAPATMPRQGQPAAADTTRASAPSPAGPAAGAARTDTTRARPAPRDTGSRRGTAANSVRH